jgi:hypothetical protein
MKTAISADGTPIAYDCAGSGDPLILVGGTPKAIAAALTQFLAEPTCQSHH